MAILIENNNIIVQLTAPSHFPIKLTSSNYPVWKTQMESILIELDLSKYVDDTNSAPKKFSDKARTTVSPAYTLWYCQDRIILSALLGSCSETLQPVISFVLSAKDAWKRLATNCAASSRG